MAENINVTLQKLYNSSAKQIQQMVNDANREGLEFNAKEAATARAWQEKMSKSSHQMEVADLKKAGLNPVLSANSGGAQSYTTSSASGSVESGAGAASGIMSGLMSTLAGIAQTKLSAQSQQRAAQISGQYNLAAAQTSANAAKYAADMNYKAQMEKPQNNLVSLIDKYFGDSISKASGASKTKVGSVLNSMLGSIGKKDYTLVSDKSGFKNLYANVNSKGHNANLDKGLKILGIDPYRLSNSTRISAYNDLLTYKLKFGSNYADSLKSLKKLANNNPYKAKTIASTSPFKGNNWNPYK